MLALAGVAVLLGLTLPIGARVLSKRRAAQAAEPVLEVPLSQPLAAEAGPASPQMPGLSELLDAGKKLQTVAPGAGALAATVAAGVVASAATGDIVEKVLGQGEGRGNAATLLGVTALPVAAAAAAGEKVAELVGLGEKGQQTLGQLAAAAAVAPPLALAVGGGKLLLAGVNAIAPGVGETISKGLSSLDPTRTDTITGKAVGVVADGVKGAANVLTFGLIGGKSKEEEAREAAEREAARQKAETVLASGAVTTQQVAKAIGGGIGGLVNLAKEVDKATQPAPVFAPTPAPTVPAIPKLPLPLPLPILPAVPVLPAPAPAPPPPAAAVVQASKVLKSLPIGASLLPKGKQAL